MRERAPGSVRELELVLVREMVLIRGRFSGPPDCLLVRVVGTERRGPLAEVTRERSRSGSFKADRMGFFVLLELARLRLPPVGCGVCVRGGRWAACWDAEGWSVEGA